LTELDEHTLPKLSSNSVGNETLLMEVFQGEQYFLILYSTCNLSTLWVM